MHYCLLYTLCLSTRICFVSSNSMYQSEGQESSNSDNQDDTNEKFFKEVGKFIKNEPLPPVPMYDNNIVSGDNDKFGGLVTSKSGDIINYPDNTMQIYNEFDNNGVKINDPENEQMFLEKPERLETSTTNVIQITTAEENWSFVSLLDSRKNLNVSENNDLAETIELDPNNNTRVIGTRLDESSVTSLLGNNEATEDTTKILYNRDILQTDIVYAKRRQEEYPEYGIVGSGLGSGFGPFSEPSSGKTSEPGLDEFNPENAQFNKKFGPSNYSKDGFKGYPGGSGMGSGIALRNGAEDNTTSSRGGLGTVNPKSGLLLLSPFNFNSKNLDNRLNPGVNPGSLIPGGPLRSGLPGMMPSGLISGSPGGYNPMSGVGLKFGDKIKVRVGGPSGHIQGSYPILPIRIGTDGQPSVINPGLSNSRFNGPGAINHENYGRGGLGPGNFISSKVESGFRNYGTVGLNSGDPNKIEGRERKKESNDLSRLDPGNIIRDRLQSLSANSRTPGSSFDYEGLAGSFPPKLGPEQGDYGQNDGRSGSGLYPNYGGKAIGFHGPGGAGAIPLQNKGIIRSGNTPSNDKMFTLEDVSPGPDYGGVGFDQITPHGIESDTHDGLEQSMHINKRNVTEIVPLPTKFSPDITPKGLFGPDGPISNEMGPEGHPVEKEFDVFKGQDANPYNIRQMRLDSSKLEGRFTVGNPPGGELLNHMPEFNRNPPGAEIPPQFNNMRPMPQFNPNSVRNSRGENFQSGPQLVPYSISQSNYNTERVPWSGNLQQRSEIESNLPGVKGPPQYNAAMPMPMLQNNLNYARDSMSGKFQPAPEFDPYPQGIGTSPQLDAAGPISQMKQNSAGHPWSGIVQSRPEIETHLPGGQIPPQYFAARPNIPNSARPSWNGNFRPNPEVYPYPPRVGIPSQYNNTGAILPNNQNYAQDARSGNFKPKLTYELILPKGKTLPQSGAIGLVLENNFRGLSNNQKLGINSELSAIPNKSIPGASSVNEAPFSAISSSVIGMSPPSGVRNFGIDEVNSRNDIIELSQTRNSLNSTIEDSISFVPKSESEKNFNLLRIQDTTATVTTVGITVANTPTNTSVAPTNTSGALTNTSGAATIASDVATKGNNTASSNNSTSTTTTGNRVMNEFFNPSTTLNPLGRISRGFPEERYRTATTPVRVVTRSTYDLLAILQEFDPTTYMPMQKELMEGYDDGLFTIFIMKMCEILAQKNDTYTTHLLLAFEPELIKIHRDFPAISMLGEPFLQAMMEYCQGIIIGPLDYLKGQLSLAHEVLKIRRTKLSSDLNAILDFVNALYLPVESQAMITVLTEVNNYEGTGKTANKIIYDALRDVIVYPFIRIHSDRPQDRYILVKGLNEYMSVNYFDNMKIVTPTIATIDKVPQIPHFGNLGRRSYNYDTFSAVDIKRSGNETNNSKIVRKIDLNENKKKMLVRLHYLNERNLKNRVEIKENLKKMREILAGVRSQTPSPGEVQKQKLSEQNQNWEIYTASKPKAKEGKKSGENSFRNKFHEELSEQYKLSSETDRSNERHEQKSYDFMIENYTTRDLKMNTSQLNVYNDDTFKPDSNLNKDQKINAKAMHRDESALRNRHDSRNQDLDKNFVVHYHKHMNKKNRKIIKKIDHLKKQHPKIYDKYIKHHRKYVHRYEHQKLHKYEKIINDYKKKRKHTHFDKHKHKKHVDEPIKLHKYPKNGGHKSVTRQPVRLKQFTEPYTIKFSKITKNTNTGHRKQSITVGSTTPRVNKTFTSSNKVVNEKGNADFSRTMLDQFSKKSIFLMASRPPKRFRTVKRQTTVHVTHKYRNKSEVTYDTSYENNLRMIRERKTRDKLKLKIPGDLAQERRPYRFDGRPHYMSPDKNDPKVYKNTFPLVTKLYWPSETSITYNKFDVSSEVKPMEVKKKLNMYKTEHFASENYGRSSERNIFKYTLYDRDQYFSTRKEILTDKHGVPWYDKKFQNQWTDESLFLPNKYRTTTRKADSKIRTKLYLVTKNIFESEGEFEKKYQIKNDIEKPHVESRYVFSDIEKKEHAHINHIYREEYKKKNSLKSPYKSVKNKIYLSKEKIKPNSKFIDLTFRSGVQNQREASETELKPYNNNELNIIEEKINVKEMPSRRKIVTGDNQRKDVIRKLNVPSSYSDDEEDIQVNLQDALIHSIDNNSSRFFYRRSGVTDLNRNVHQINVETSGSDEEHIIKSNIYKSLGYNDTAFRSLRH